MIATSLISLAAQYSPVAAKFYVFDGSPPDSPQAGYLERVAQLLPHGVQVVAYRDVATAIDEVTRNHLNVPGAPTAFLFIYGLQRYRMLRQEEEWVSGYSSSDEGEAPKTDKQFGAILREGPHAGVHTIAWCDTANNLSRALDRQSLKEFEIRVLFQMSATDSSNLIDAPFASKLGMHRALFFSEEQGHLEKFRPYAVPDVHWLNEALGAMRERSGSGG
jgi:DNA segregation ATPase FtsK/SpoIIIE, S-DNA-T family